MFHGFKVPWFQIMFHVLHQKQRHVWAQEGTPVARPSSTMSHSSGSVADRPSSGILLEVPSAMAPHLMANDEKDKETNRTG